MCSLTLAREHSNEALMVASRPSWQQGVLPPARHEAAHPCDRCMGIGSIAEMSISMHDAAAARVTI